jgi:hypothetical protein
VRSALNFSGLCGITNQYTITTSTTMDIFNPNNGPDERNEASLHSLEQNKTKRDILAWTVSSGNDEVFTPGKKIGPRNNRIAFVIHNLISDIYLFGQFVTG